MRRYHVLGAPLGDFYAWAVRIHSPFDASVVAASDGWPERNPVHFVRDLAVVLKNALTFNPKEANALRMVLGNHVVLKMAAKDVYALIAHALQLDWFESRKGADVPAGPSIWRMLVLGKVHTAPAFSIDGQAGPPQRRRPALRLSGLRGVAGRRVVEGDRWDAGEEGIRATWPRRSAIRERPAAP